jgi:hypothetical protein
MPTVTQSPVCGFGDDVGAPDCKRRARELRRQQIVLASHIEVKYIDVNIIGC